MSLRSIAATVISPTSRHIWRLTLWQRVGMRKMNPVWPSHDDRRPVLKVLEPSGFVRITFANVCRQWLAEHWDRLRPSDPADLGRYRRDWRQES